MNNKLIKHLDKIFAKYYEKRWEKAKEFAMTAYETFTPEMKVIWYETTNIHDRDGIQEIVSSMQNEIMFW